MAANDWKLEWFYFDALEVLYKEGPGCTDGKQPSKAYRAYLYFKQSIQTPENAPDRQEREEVYEDGDPLLIRFARTAIAQVGPIDYAWTKEWPLAIKFYDRVQPYANSTKRGYDSVFVSPSSCYLPWPLPCLSYADGSAERAARVLGLISSTSPIGTPAALDVIPADAVPASSLLRAYDTAFAENPTEASRNVFRSTAGKNLLNAMVSEASQRHNRTMTLPQQNFGVRWDAELAAEQIKTDETHFAKAGTALELVLGTREPPGDTVLTPENLGVPFGEGLDPNGFNPQEITVARIPCGSFDKKKSIGG